MIAQHEAQYGISLKGIALSEVIATNPTASIFKSVLDTMMARAALVG